jgi:hypothetical protein
MAAVGRIEPANGGLRLYPILRYWFDRRTGQGSNPLGGEWLPSQESNLPHVRLTAGRVHLARLTGIGSWWSDRESNSVTAILRGSPAAHSSPCYLVDQAGNDPAASSSPTRRSPFELLARAWSWFRATLFAPSTRRFHQISLPDDLVRMPVIETGPDEWRSSARPSSYTRLFGGKWTESNLLPKRTAFTAQRRHQPVLICTSRTGGNVRS